MLSRLDKEKLEYYKILSIAINLEGTEKDEYLKEQRERLRQIMSNEQKEELDRITKTI